MKGEGGRETQVKTRIRPAATHPMVGRNGLASIRRTPMLSNCPRPGQRGFPAVQFRVKRRMQAPDLAGSEPQAPKSARPLTGTARDFGWSAPDLTDCHTDLGFSVTEAVAGIVQTCFYARQSRWSRLERKDARKLSKKNEPG